MNRKWILLAIITGILYGTYWLYAQPVGQPKGVLGRIGDALKSGINRGGNSTAGARAMGSPAATAYETYATAMAIRDYPKAMEVSAQEAEETARLRVGARSGRTKNMNDQRYLSKAALEQMARSRSANNEPEEYSYDYERLDLSVSGEMAKISATQRVDKGEGNFIEIEHRATVMRFDGEWKVTSFVLMD